MARVSKNSIFEALSGALGKDIVFKQYADKTVASKYPDMSQVKPSELQKLQRNKMTEANAYASAALRDPKLRKKYEKNLKPGETVFQKAKKDFFENLKKEKLLAAKNCP